MKVNLKYPLRILTMAWLLLLLIGYVVLDTVFGISHFLWGEQKPVGYVAPTSPLVVQVPTLIGFSFSADTLPDQRFFTCEVTYVYHPTAPATMVLEQYPVGGAYRKIMENRPCPISLVVSMGKEQIPLPDLRGMSAEEAENILHSHGLVPKRKYVTTQDSHDIVISTLPSPHTLLDREQTVEICIGQTAPQAPLPCPNLVGLTIMEATEALDKAGLALGNVQQAEILDPWHIREGYTNQTVITQSAPAGSYLPYRYKVDVTVTNIF